MSSQRTEQQVARLSDHFEGILENFLAETSRDPIPNLHDAMRYALGADIAREERGGKRIRPVLCFLSAEALGADLELAEPFALAIELMHTFCLVHDDLEDGDTMRRGRDSVWIKYGIPHGVNIGDFILVQTQRVLTDWGTERLTPTMRFRLLKLLGHVLERTHIGQALDIGARGHRQIDTDDYMRLVREKTGFYLAGPIQGGAMVAGGSDDLIEKIGEMAQLLGPMFQIMDDIIDLTEGKGRDARGSDIREGKRSYLVAHTAALCSDDERNRLFDILDLHRAETTAEHIDWVDRLFEVHGAMEAGRTLCDELYTHSLELLNECPKPLAEALAPVFNLLARRQR